MTARQNYGVEGKKEEVKSVQVVLRQRTAWHPSIYLSLYLLFKAATIPSVSLSPGRRPRPTMTTVVYHLLLLLPFFRHGNTMDEGWGMT